MSDSHALEAAKAHAKHLLALVRAGDVTVIRELRQSLPRLAAEDDAGFAANVKLADVQHAMAVGRGLKSWAELRQLIELANPVTTQAERFLHAVREEQESRAAELLHNFPAIARYSIHAAAAACDPAAVSDFLQQDPALVHAPAPPNKAHPIIYAVSTPLHTANPALANGNAACVALLLDAGADPNAFILFDGAEGVAPIPALYFATVMNNVFATRLLLERGANPNDGESVYHTAERNNHECLALLVQFGADISSAHAVWENTPLYFLSGYKPFSPRCESSERGMQWLLEHGADPNVPSHTGPKYAQSASRSELPLHAIAFNGKSSDVARMLVEHGANVDTPRGDGKTAYALAVRAGNTAVASHLASVGANTMLIAPVDELIGACLAGDEPRARGIVARHPSVTDHLSLEDRQAIVLAVEEQREDSIRLMLALGWDLTVEGPWGGTPLHQAAWFGRQSLVRLLVELGAPINKRDSTYGSSPIAWAAHGSTNGRPGQDEDYCAVVNTLLDAGAEREASYNKWKEAPESMSTKAVARLLKDRGFSA